MFKTLLLVSVTAFIILRIASGDWLRSEGGTWLKQATAGGVMTGTEKAIFAGGCFWCMESSFEETPGVADVISGYTGGDGKITPTYAQVSSGRTGYYEAVEVVYDPEKVSYDKLLRIFGENIDPLDDGGQFADRGSQYKTAVFYQDVVQHMQARSWLNEIGRRLAPRKPAVSLLPAGAFFPAEDEHQDYHRKHPAEYRRYAVGSGRYEKLKHSPLKGMAQELSPTRGGGE